MTKQEIKDLIAAKIAGQGNQVDIGNALAEVLNALADNVDAAQQAANNIKVLDLTPYAEQIENNEPIPGTDELIGALYEASVIKIGDALYPLLGLYPSDSPVQYIYDNLITYCPEGYQVRLFSGAYGSALFALNKTIDSGSLYIPVIVKKGGMGESFVWFYYAEY